MILASLPELKNYKNLIPQIEAIELFVSNLSESSWPSPKIEIDGNNLIGIFIEGNAPVNEASVLTMEAHQKYYDLHFIFSGSENMAMKSKSNCSVIERPYDSENDYILYKENPATRFTIQQNHFVFLTPDDIHISVGTETGFKKVVFKILIP